MLACKLHMCHTPYHTLLMSFHLTLWKSFLFLPRAYFSNTHTHKKKTLVCSPLSLKQEIWCDRSCERSGLYLDIRGCPGADSFSNSSFGSLCEQNPFEVNREEGGIPAGGSRGSQGRGFTVKVRVAKQLVVLSFFFYTKACSLYSNPQEATEGEKSTRRWELVVDLGFGPSFCTVVSQVSTLCVFVNQPGRRHPGLLWFWSLFCQSFF